LLLADSSFDRRQLWNSGGLRRGWRGLLWRVVFVGAGLLIVAWWSRGTGGLFYLPRQRPLIWLGVVVLYPIFSVYPQELMYRTFFFHRYGRLFARPTSLIAVNGLLFGWSHIIVHHRVAILLASIGGWLFAWTYQRWRSTALVALEHGLYGDFIFSVGIGGMFLNGVRLLSHLFK
jgi:membrane protease YdiL (CAAX protease family)